MTTAAHAILWLRLPPLIHILWVHPVDVWPLASAAVISSPPLALLGIVLWSFNQINIIWWRALEGLHLSVWLALDYGFEGTAVPAGGVSHALVLVILACRIEPSKGKDRA